MRRKNKLIVIILISIILTYFIYFFNREEKIRLVAIGDGIASGETSYNIDGISYNDYIKEYFDSKKLLKNYNNNYAFKNYKLEELINDIKNNVIDKKSNMYIEQIMHKANIVTICIGEDELTKLEITQDLDEEGKEILDRDSNPNSVVISQYPENTNIQDDEQNNEESEQINNKIEQVQEQFNNQFEQMQSNMSEEQQQLLQEGMNMQQELLQMMQ